MTPHRWLPPGVPRDISGMSFLPLTPSEAPPSPKATIRSAVDTYPGLTGDLPTRDLTASHSHSHPSSRLAQQWHCPILHTVHKGQQDTGWQKLCPHKCTRS